MLTLIIAAIIGTLAGLLSALPGLHISILLIGALPLLAINGPAGAIALTTAIGSGLISSNLAKTFHPATAETIKSATPEQAMAYTGNGYKALAIQHQAVWSGVLTVLLLALCSVPLKLIMGHDFDTIVQVFSSWLIIPLIILFLTLV